MQSRRRSRVCEPLVFFSQYQGGEPTPPAAHASTRGQSALCQAYPAYFYLFIYFSHREGGAGGEVVLLEAAGVGLAAEHVEHLARHEEAAADVEGGDEHRGRRQPLGGALGDQAALHHEQAAHGGDAADGVGHGHQGGVQRGSHAPHHLQSGTDKKRSYYYRRTLAC
eukprot:1196107-Prorocentrum_minimum.AAC.3